MKKLTIKLLDVDYNWLNNEYKNLYGEDDEEQFNTFVVNCLSRGLNNVNGILFKGDCPRFFRYDMDKPVDSLAIFYSLHKDSHEVK